MSCSGASGDKSLKVYLHQVVVVVDVCDLICILCSVSVGINVRACEAP
jgi:hypothetical protein